MYQAIYTSKCAILKIVNFYYTEEPGPSQKARERVEYIHSPQYMQYTRLRGFVNNGYIRLAPSGPFDVARTIYMP